FPIAQCCPLCIVFFFSSRRRHTRSLRDWSSDVCSSDLAVAWRLLDPGDARVALADDPTVRRAHRLDRAASTQRRIARAAPAVRRSEERRVGKERRATGTARRENRQRERERQEENQRAAH